MAALLMIGVLTKLAGQESSRAMAHWARLREEELGHLFQLKRETMPHYSTWSRVLGQTVSPEEVEQAVSQFFTAEKLSRWPKRGSIQVCLDGKTSRGAIPAGQSHGVHLMAAYLPKQGVVVTGDAMQAQRKLSVRIVQAHGDYVWTTKGNQPEMREEIALLFAPQQSRPGWSATPTDFRRATTINKGHGRLEKRTITVSSLLAGYSAFPYVAQVFQVEIWVQLTGDRSRHEVRCGRDPLARRGRLIPTAQGAGAWAVGHREWPALSTG